jgi:hypothetical protein
MQSSRLDSRGVEFTPFDAVAASRPSHTLEAGLAGYCHPSSCRISVLGLDLSGCGIGIRCNALCELSVVHLIRGVPIDAEALLCILVRGHSQQDIV